MSALTRASVLRRWEPTRSNPWDRGAAAHLLRRAGFGPAPGEVERTLDEGVEATLARLRRAPEGYEEARDGIGALLGVGRIDHLQAWWMSLIVGAGAPLVERVALLWHDHFATSYDKVGDVRLMHRQNELFREHGLGDFRALLRAVAKDPAMLVWLDGDANRRGAPNENFAREVMELFALGIGNYSEGDVREAARAFTGWGTRGRSFAFRAEHHDAGPKTILGSTAAFDGGGALDAILAHPACPRHVARRLLAGFVDAAPDEATVEETASLLVDRGHDVGAVLDVLLTSELFFERRFRRGRIAGPVELVARTVRRLELAVAPRDLALAAERMGQSLFRPPSVKGWDGGRDWINAGTWLARHNDLASSVLRGDGTERRDVRAAIGGDGPDALLSALFPEGASPALRDALARASDEGSLATLVALVLTSPEYQLT